MVHPATYIDTAFKVAGGDTTYRNVGRRFSAARRVLPSLWLALPTDRDEINYAFIYMRNPTIADVGQKIQDFYTMYVALSTSDTDNGALGGAVYPEGAVAAEDLSNDNFHMYDDSPLCVVAIQFGS